MDSQDGESAAIVRKLKDGARANPRVPDRVPPQEHFHHFSNGLSLCFTLDVLTTWYISDLARLTGTKPPDLLRKGGQFWHLSVTRLGGRRPSQEELDSWRRAFFEEAPIWEMWGMLPGVNSRHFFWEYE